VDFGSDIAQFQVAACAPRAGEQSDQHSQATAINKNYFFEVQNDIALVPQKGTDALAEQLRLGAGNDAPTATDESNIPDTANIERESHRVCHHHWGEAATL